MFSKIVDIMTPLSDIKDNSIIAISGFNMATTPEYLILELYRQYNELGHPKKTLLRVSSLVMSYVTMLRADCGSEKHAN
jgi:propionate CoA-transferase